MTGHLDDRQLEAVLDGADLAQVHLHLDGCGWCQAALAARRELRAARRAALPTLTAEQSARMGQRFMRAVANPVPTRTTAGWRLTWQLATVAALASAAAVVAVSLTRPTDDAVADDETAAPAIAQRPAGATRAIAAPTRTTARISAAPTAPPSMPSATARAGASATPQQPAAMRRVSGTGDGTGAPAIASVDTAALLRERATLLTQSGQFEQAADVYLASLAAAQTAAEIEPALAEYKTLVKLHVRELEPRAIAVRAEYIATLALPAPFAEEAGHLACESALTAKSYASAYQLCHRYLELFSGSARTRDVAYLTASVARLYLGDCQAAIEHYTEALVFSSTFQSFNDEAYLGRALCYTQLGQLDAARRDLDLYLHKRPDQVESATVRDLTRRLQDDHPR